jgi:alpha-tubulin suppressor-like RCC1 family protein
MMIDWSVAGPTAIAVAVAACAGTPGGQESPLVGVNDTPGQPAAPEPTGEDTRRTSTIALSRHRSCAIDDGSVVCWGSGANQEKMVWLAGLAHQRSATTAAATRVRGLDDVVEIAAAKEAFCARTATGAVHCWPEGDLTKPKLAVAGGAERLVCHDAECCTVGSGDANICWGQGRAAGKRPLPPKSELNGCRLHGDARACRTATDSSAGNQLTNVVDSAFGDDHSCALHDDGRVSCWGDNDHGQLGDGSREKRSVPVAVVGVNDARELAASDGHSCVRTGGGALRCWGDNSVGQVDGIQPSSFWKVRAIPGLVDVVGIDSGLMNTCAWQRDGSVHCWGYGVPVEDERRYRCEPKPVSVATFRGLDRVVSGSPPWKLAGGVLAPFDDSERHVRVADVALGHGHQCLVQTNGRVLCRGRNNRGQADPTLMVRHQNQFAAIAGVPPSRAVALGGDGSCALSRSGSLYCWGTLSSVDPMKAADPRPRPVAGAHGLTSIGIGYFGSLCATPLRGGVSCWFERKYKREQISIDIPTAAQVVGNGDFFCARTRAGKVWCFREPGQDTQTGPRVVEGLDDATALTLGRDHGCALRNDGTVACWGDGRACQLGEPTSRRTAVTMKLRPVDTAGRE